MVMVYCLSNLRVIIPTSAGIFFSEISSLLRQLFLEDYLCVSDVTKFFFENYSLQCPFHIQKDRTNLCNEALLYTIQSKQIS